MKKTVLGTFFMLAAVTSMFAAKKNGTVRYLNFKPEVASIYQELAEAYEKETGVKVIVETAAKPSGITATARLTAVMNISSGSLPYKRPITNISAHIASAAIPKVLPNLFNLC